MVKIRLARHGSKKRPFYHIVVANSAMPLSGRYIEKIGFFNPSARGQEERLRLNVARFEHWGKQGAQVTDRVKSLMKKDLKEEVADVASAA